MLKIPDDWVTSIQRTMQLLYTYLFFCCFPSFAADTLARAPDGGILVNKHFESSVPGVYAIGDCCTVAAEQQAQQWFQMRLWTQARLMGMYAAHCMAGHDDDLGLDFNFELVGAGACGFRV